MKWLSLLLILFLMGCAVPPLQFYEYEYELIEPIKSDALQYEDENVNISFRIGLDDVSFIILNKLNKPITLLYERAVYVDQFNLAHDTTHSTLSLLAPFEIYSPPRVIPPKTGLHNYFAPIEKIEAIRNWEIFALVEPSVRDAGAHPQWKVIERKVATGKMRKSEREKEKRRLLSELDEQAKSNVGKIIGVFLPIEIDGKVENYFFKFEITDVEFEITPEPASNIVKIAGFLGGSVALLILAITVAAK